MPIPTTDLEWLFKESGGLRVRSGGQATWGHLETVEESMFEGTQARVKGTSHVLTMAHGKITDLSIGTAIDVDGSDYTVRDREQINTDEVRVWLKEA